MKNKPKCSCYGGFDCEVCNPVKDHTEQHLEMVSDTPRTDAVAARPNWPWHIQFEMRQLERELKRANDEIEFYEKIGQEKVDELRASKAEVERLKGQLQQAVDIAEWYMDNLVQSPRKDKLEAIKATLNPTDK